MEVGTISCRLCKDEVTYSQRPSHLQLADHLGKCPGSQISHGGEIPPPSRATSREEQRDIALWILASWKKASGREYCVMDAKWYRHWELFVGINSAHDASTPAPGIINNWGFLQQPDEDGDGDGEGGTLEERKAGENNEATAKEASSPSSPSSHVELKIGLREEWDYVTVPAPLAARLFEWYGGGPVVMRRVVGVGMLGATLHVELHPITLDFVIRPVGGHEKPKQAHMRKEFSRQVKLYDVKHICAREHNVAPHKIKLFIGNYNDKGDLEESPITPEMMRVTIEDMGLANMQVIIIEKETAPTLAAHPRGAYTPSGLYSGGGRSYSGYITQNEKGTPLQRGICGLHNLGNTCFMNSSLQCLSAIMPLTLYFLSKDPKVFQVKNKKGTRGKMALSFSSFLSDVWGGHLVNIVPRSVKSVISEYAPQFCGYAQHDAQEFLAYLLSALHEDLNAAHEEGSLLKSSDGTDIEELRRSLTRSYDECWEEHITKNSSKIVSLFHGQLRSSIQCHECKNGVTTYDPFAYLSLPVPSNPYRKIELFLLPLSGAAMRYCVRVPKAGQVKHLKNALSELCGIPASRLVVSETMHHRMFEAPDGKALFDVKRRDILCAHELVECDGEVQRLTCINRREWRKDRWESFGTPFLVSCAEGTSWGAVVAMIHARLESFIGRANFNVSIRVVPMAGDAKPREIELSDVCAINPEEAIGIFWSEQDAPDAVFSPDAVPNHESVENREEDEELVVELDQCLRQYGEAEELSDSNKWYCPTCEERHDATKQLEVWKLPEVVLICLKRFQFDRFLREKVQSLVTFPLEGLQLSQFLPEESPDYGKDAPYDLCGVVDHEGGLSSGHYIARIRSPIDSKWYSCNDSRVSSLDAEKVVSKSAYVLFYRRRPEAPEDEVSRLPEVVEDTSKDAEAPSGGASSGEAGESASGSSVGSSSSVSSLRGTEQENATPTANDSNGVSDEHGSRKRRREGGTDGGLFFQPTRRMQDVDATDDVCSNWGDEPGVSQLGPMPSTDLTHSVYLCPYCQSPFHDMQMLAMHMLDYHGDASYFQ